MTGSARVAEPRTVLVTGAAGFIGSALCRRLVSLGHRVVGYDNLSRGRREYLPTSVQLLEGDIRDAAGVREAIAAARPDCVIHLAAMHFIPDCVARPQETIDVNVEGTRRVLDSCRGGSVKSIVFASTAAVYRPSTDPCVEDVTPLGPLEVYGESKLAGEQLASGFHRETGTPISILRLFNAIGRNETNPHVIPHIFDSLGASDAVKLGNLTPRRDYVDTRDIAEALVLAADYASGLDVFNVGTGMAHSVQDIVEHLGVILGRPIAALQDPARMRTSERMVLVADIERIRRVTGWSPRFSLDETLVDMVAAYGLRRQSAPRDANK
jgi:UDP-glucose 4-epimerase